ncbi:MAG: sulfurtransferase complex subunit TusB [Candidatus Oceanisphaera merdipullorum]|nr:sulfurtransferase complex subunit TusB [Candidatus Oceanisphaera merdipullorum]
MLHTVKHSPFSHQALAHALAALQPDDQLLLWQDGVIAATVGQGQAFLWQAPLQALANSRRLYVMAEDVQARGLSLTIGLPISMSEWVALVATWGSPQAW